MATGVGLGTICRNSDIVRFVKVGVVKTFRWWDECKVTPRTFNKGMLDRGYRHEKTRFGNYFTCEIDGRSCYVHRDSVRGSAWRLDLAYGNVPDCWPALPGRLETVPEWTQAESPWWEYFTDLDPTDPLDAQCDSREQALQKCWDWFVSAGEQWLNDPTSRTAAEWRIHENILVRTYGSPAMRPPT